MYTIGSERYDEIYKNLCLGVQYVYECGVQGNIAEFGTASGRTAVLLAATQAFCNNTLAGIDKGHNIGLRRLFLFDSFVGLPTATSDVDASSVHVASGLWPAGGCRGLTKDQLFSAVNQHLPADNIMIFDGWFSESLPTVPAGETFALVHVDCDLYQSAMDVLDWLFAGDKLNDGSMILFDDWNCNRASPEFGERRAWREIVEKYHPSFSDCGDYGVASHKFIIHKS
jgi:hypothetical protein